MPPESSDQEAGGSFHMRRVGSGRRLGSSVGLGGGAGSSSAAPAHDDDGKRKSSIAGGGGGGNAGPPPLRDYMNVAGGATGPGVKGNGPAVLPKAAFTRRRMTVNMTRRGGVKPSKVDPSFLGPRLASEYRAKMRVTSNYLLLLAALGLVAMLVENEVRNASNDNIGVDPDDSARSVVVMVASSIESLTTLILVGLLYRFYALGLAKGKCRNRILPHASITSSGQLPALLGEMLVCLMHVPPFWAYPTASPAFGEEHNWILNTLSVAMFGRVYLFVRCVQHNSYLMKRAGHLISELANLRFNTGFIVKAVLNQHPITTVSLTLLVTMVLSAYTIFTYERSTLKQLTAGESIWLVVITMTTVGYGDFRPVTVIGRVAAIFAASMGVFLTALIIGVIHAKLQLTTPQSRVLMFWNRAKALHTKKKYAALVIQNAWWYYLARKEGAPEAQCRNHYDRVFWCVHKFRDHKKYGDNTGASEGSATMHLETIMYRVKELSGKAEKTGSRIQAIERLLGVAEPLPKRSSSSEDEDEDEVVAAIQRQVKNMPRQAPAKPALQQKHQQSGLAASGLASGGFAPNAPPSASAVVRTAADAPGGNAGGRSSTAPDPLTLLDERTKRLGDLLERLEARLGHETEVVAQAMTRIGRLHEKVDVLMEAAGEGVQEAHPPATFASPAQPLFPSQSQTQLHSHSHPYASTALAAQPASLSTPAPQGNESSPRGGGTTTSRSVRRSRRSSRDGHSSTTTRRRGGGEDTDSPGRGAHNTTRSSQQQQHQLQAPDNSSHHSQGDGGPSPQRHTPRRRHAEHGRRSSKSSPRAAATGYSPTRSRAPPPAVQYQSPAAAMDEQRVDGQHGGFHGQGSSPPNTLGLGGSRGGASGSGGSGGRASSPTYRSGPSARTVGIGAIPPLQAGPPPPSLPVINKFSSPRQSNTRP